ncbi:PREDICTED: uncharacterized protein At1g43920, Chloroplastic-like [Camelina sativa]|uniref:Uncharacterized protein At1g43920, Chloroplastic-like n=1 Tax=Camelina sativa TaxID=90675 RepID=A0ABM0TDF9_CAMSA|nr:PREDICTED: uncharacterized protein At1g43920, Chloroplastic-like [Camelina sativa]
MDLSTDSSSMSRSSGILKKCDCGLPAKIFTSKTEKNPGRRFFGCQLYKDGGTEHCKYFKWFDQEEVKGWPRNALIQVVAENREKERVIYQLKITIVELRSDLEKHLEDSGKVIYRQRLIITSLTGLLVFAVGTIIFGRCEMSKCV